MTTEAQLAGAPGTEEITRLLAKMREGHPEAEEELLSRAYDQPRTLTDCKAAARLPSS
jgi:hypothetical protein